MSDDLIKQVEEQARKAVKELPGIIGRLMQLRDEGRLEDWLICYSYRNRQDEEIVAEHSRPGHGVAALGLATHAIRLLEQDYEENEESEDEEDDP